MVVALTGLLFKGETGPDGFDNAVDSPVIAFFRAHHGLLPWFALPGDLVPAIVISAAIAAGCLIAKRPNGVVLAVAAVPAAAGLDDGLLKHLFHRTYLGALSFPSGHTTSVTGMTATLAILLLVPPQEARTRTVRATVVAVACVITVMVIIGVIGLRWHYFTDTAAGAAVGIGTVLGLALLIDLAAAAIGRSTLVTMRPAPLIIATILRDEGNTGVHTHIRQLRRYLQGSGVPSAIITPFSWGKLLRGPVFCVRLALERPLPAASVVWYRHWHELFLRRALRAQLARLGDCVIYAQCPLSAKAALRARQGPHQRVILAVHFRISQADEWAGKELIKPGGTVYRKIRQLERETIPRVDKIVYVSNWARDALLAWLPEAAEVPSATIGNFVAPLTAESRRAASRRPGERRLP